jgi:adenine-specific DNA methylase
VNYAELADFWYVWLRLLLKQRYPHFAPEYTPKVEEIVENRTRGKSEEDFYAGLAEVFSRIHKSLPDDGILAFTFHHKDEQGTVWEGLLTTLCKAGYEIAAIYPIQAEAESSTHHQGKENITYDLIHVCRKRRDVPQPRSWAGIRQEVRRKARQELEAIQKGRYGNQPLAEGDRRLICIGKCLELYSAHYDKVLDHEGKTLPLRSALRDISTTVDQLVTSGRALPPELEDSIDPVSYTWFRVLMKIKREVTMNDISKQLRAGVSADDLKKEGLIVWGRTGRGRTYEVKQPLERLPDLMERLKAGLPNENQGTLFDEQNQAYAFNVTLVDVLHLLIGLADRKEPVYQWLKRFDSRRAQIRAGLRFILGERLDWKDPIERILEVLDGAPLLEGGKP